MTVHETGHQFWYGIVANNEFEDAWLDEGITTYSTDRVMLKTFGSTPLSKRHLDGFFPILFEGIHRTFRIVGGLGRTCEYSVVGVGAILDGLSTFLNGKLFQEFWQFWAWESCICSVGLFYPGKFFISIT